MKTFLLILLLTASSFVWGAEEPSSSPFEDPVTGFSTALLPLLTSFEKASVQTTLRGLSRGGTPSRASGNPKWSPVRRACT